MAWIESHQKLEKHPKLLDLCNKTGWNRAEAVGKLHLLWWWALDYAEDGDLSRYEPHQYFSGFSEKIDAKDLFIIFQDTNFIEKTGVIHDWLDYAGRYLHSKYHSSNPKKWKEIRKKHKYDTRRPFRKPLVNLKEHIPNQPNLTIPNQPNHILSQIENLLGLFPSNTQSKIKVYLERVAISNKSKVITEGRKLTLLTELHNTKQRCADVTLFEYALDMAINYDACNIGYVNAIVRNKKKVGQLR